MLEAYFVEGMPVVNSIWNDDGVAVGKTGDGEYSYRSNADGKVYRYRTTDIFYVPNIADVKEECVLKTMSSFKKSINYFFGLYKYLLDGDITADEFIIRANGMVCPDGVGDNSPAKEYFYKMKEAFIGVLNARLKEFTAQKEFVTSVCGNAIEGNNGLKRIVTYGKYADELIKLLLDKGEISEEEAKTMKACGFSRLCLNSYLSFGEIFVTHDLEEATKVRNKFREKYHVAQLEDFYNTKPYIVYGCDFPYDDMGVDDRVWPEEEVEEDDEDELDF